MLDFNTEKKSYMDIENPSHLATPMGLVSQRQFRIFTLGRLSAILEFLNYIIIVGLALL